MKGRIHAAGAFCLLAAAARLEAAPCVAGVSLSSYIALGATGCTIDSVLFYNFRTLDTQPGALPIVPDSVLVNPISELHNPGFQFVFNMTASFGGLLQATWGFNAVGAHFVGNTASMAGAGATADAAVSVIEDKCLGGNFSPGTFTGCPTTSGQLVLFQFDPQSQLSAQLNFAAVTALDIVNEAVIDAGADGVASLGSVNNRFQVLPMPDQDIPEPASAALAAVGLAAAVLLRCRYAPS